MGTEFMSFMGTDRRRCVAVRHSRLVHPGPDLLRVLVPLVLLTASICWGLVTGYGALGLFALTGLTVLLVAAWRSALNGSRSTSTKARLLLRKELASAREYCRTELRKPTPALDDSWYQYVLAFGLGRHVDKWFRAFGGPTATRSGSGYVTSHSTSDSGSGSSSARRRFRPAGAFCRARSRHHMCARAG